MGDVKVKRVDVCLKHGANPNNRHGPGVTALTTACYFLNNRGVCPLVLEQMVSLLLEHGAEVNQQDFYGDTALHYALKSCTNLFLSEENLASKQRVVQNLIQHNADIYLKDSSGLSAIDMAKREGHESWLRTYEASLTGTCSRKGKRSCSI
ncbi:ankyrin repeat [Paramuricea clavata]|uniref:Ankyrin repeat n=1 Tax=Paramuricea clavata TaxID=317549 RepID=A0A6S7IFW2_PARCT|nr:ankyrin repeat [Paramuricea clavata]